MLALILLCLTQVNGELINYAKSDLLFLKEEFNNKTGAAFYDILILQVHINVNAKYVENTIDEEIARIVDKHNVTECLQPLDEVKRTTKDFCRMEQEIDLLDETRYKFIQLKRVVYHTVELCQELNPLTTQRDTLEQCELSKIADLRQQSVLVSREFETLKKQLFESHDKCIRDIMASAFTTIAHAAYTHRESSRGAIQADHSVKH